MAGFAKTKNFMLSTATVMIGPMADLHKLNSDEHSIGLVKNFQMTADPTFVELGQGIKNTIVMSVKNGDGVKCSMEVYEYTMRNLAYAAGLDGSGTAFDNDDKIYLATTASGTSVEINATVDPGWQPGDFIFLQNGVDDKVHIAKVLTAVFAATKVTLTLAIGYEIPASQTFPAGTRVGRVKRIDIGGDAVQPEFGVKIVGLLPKDNAPFTILIPRAKITKGLGIAFQSDNFTNLPFEFTPYAGVPGDPFYTDYKEAAAILFAR